MERRGSVYQERRRGLPVIRTEGGISILDSGSIGTRFFLKFQYLKTFPLYSKLFLKFIIITQVRSNNKDNSTLHCISLSLDSSNIYDTITYI